MKSATRPQPTVDELAVLLETTLARTLEEYRSLRKLIVRRRDALRRADARAIASAADEERRALARIADLDRVRGETALSLATRLGVAGATAASLKLNDLTPRLPAQRSESVAVVATLLRDEIEACRRDSSVLRTAAEALAQHVTGVVHAVHRALSGAETYSRAGRLAVAAPIRSIDLRT